MSDWEGYGSAAREAAAAKGYPGNASTDDFYKVSDWLYYNTGGNPEPVILSYQHPQPTQAPQQLAPQQAAPSQAPAAPAQPSATIPQPAMQPRQLSQQQPSELAYVPYTGEVPSAQGLQLGFNPNFPAYNVPERVYGGRGGGAGGPGFPGETFLEEDISPFVPFLV